MLNREREQLSELQIVCGVPARKIGILADTETPRQWMPLFSSFLISLHQFNEFDQPSADLVFGFQALRDLAKVIDGCEFGVIECDSLADLVRIVSDLESMSILLKEIDSPSFAIWCGNHKSPAREQLKNLRTSIENSLSALRSDLTHVHVVTSSDPQSIKGIRTEIRKAALLGIRVQTVQLLWCDRMPPKFLKKWASKLVMAGAGIVWLCSGGKPAQVSKILRSNHVQSRVLKPGALVEVGPDEYLYATDFVQAKKHNLKVGVYANYLVIELDGVRRFLTLPSACSRMQAHNCVLSSTHISVYFTVKGELWPNH